MSTLYTPRTFDEWFDTTESGAVPRDSTSHGLDRSMPVDPASEPPRLYTVWETFCDRACAKWQTQGVLFFTLTVHSKLKYNNKYLVRADPNKQAKYFKFLVKKVLSDFEIYLKKSIHYYGFFEFNKQGYIHVHGMIYPEDCETIFAYPYFAKAFKDCAKKVGFDLRGTDCEPVKFFGDVKRYISKDMDKQHIVYPIYG